MSRFSALLSRSIFAGIFLATFVGANAAQADTSTYRGGGFTVSISSGEAGYHYHGCDSKGHCIDLDNGERWRDGDARGIGWFSEDRKYNYNITFHNGPIVLVAAKGPKILLRLRLSPVTDKVERANVQWATYCQVTNISSGQLALRSSPNGKSFAGLDNGNSVLLKKKQGNWDSIHVISGSNSSVNNLEGWVNSNYLKCSAPEPID